MCDSATINADHKSQCRATTLIYHALLCPPFNKNQGNRCFMRAWHPSICIAVLFDCEISGSHAIFFFFPRSWRCKCATLEFHGTVS